VDTKYVLIVANEPSPELEQEYNEWYNEKHIPIMLEFEGIKKAARFRRISDNPDCSKYLAVYYFDTKEDMSAFARSPEFADAIKDFDAKWKDRGFERKWGAAYQVVKSWEK